jgi:ABC-type multidrug transport system fused ATPase/permease subunit
VHRLRTWLLGGRPERLTADPIVRAVEQARIDTAGAVADLTSQAGSPGRVRTGRGGGGRSRPVRRASARTARTAAVECGRHAEALLHVERVRQRLADDLGIAPSGEVRNAHVAALQGDDRFCPVPMQLPSDLPWILRGVTMTIPAGRATALVGPNGGGKSW